MIVGMVGASLIPTVILEIKGEAGQSVTVDVLVDTGFNGYLTLPLDVLQRLQAPSYDKVYAVLADGSEIVAARYLVRVVWDGTEMIIGADEAEGLPLIGMELMLDYTVSVEAWNGGQVTITRR